MQKGRYNPIKQIKSLSKLPAQKARTRRAKTQEKITKRNLTASRLTKGDFGKKLRNGKSSKKTAMNRTFY